MNLDGSELKNTFSFLSKKGLPDIFTKVTELRKGFLCSNCNWHTHKAINISSRVVTYSKQFCHHLYDDFIDILYQKYNKIFKLMLLFDEWVYFTYGEHIMRSGTMRAIYRRYINIISKCRGDSKR